MNDWPVSTRLYALGYTIADRSNWLDWALFKSRWLVFFGAVSTLLNLPVRLWWGEELIGG